MARTTDTLFVAMSRPAVFRWGVPFDGFVANTVGTTVLTLAIIHRPPGFLIGVVVHFALRELFRIDPHFFVKARVWHATKFKSFGRTLLWGGSYLAPAHHRIKSAKELQVSV
jgi:type IV secretory pathway VirB3-like protein